MKKILLTLSVLLLLGAGTLYALKGKSSYESGKYSLKIRPADKPFGVGSSIDYTLPDQFGKAHSASPETRTLVFAFTKAAGHMIKTAMQRQPKGFLDRHHAVIIADFSQMPTIIQNMFALPDLRKSDYAMLLIYDAKMAKRLREGQPTDKVIIMRLNEGRVTAIDTAATPKALLQLMN